MGGAAEGDGQGGRNNQTQVASNPLQEEVALLSSEPSTERTVV